MKLIAVLLIFNLAALCQPMKVRWLFLARVAKLSADYSVKNHEGYFNKVIDEIELLRPGVVRQRFIDRHDPEISRAYHDDMQQHIWLMDEVWEEERLELEKQFFESS